MSPQLAPEAATSQAQGPGQPFPHRTLVTTLCLPAPQSSERLLEGPRQAGLFLGALQVPSGRYLYRLPK